MYRLNKITQQFFSPDDSLGSGAGDDPLMGETMDILFGEETEEETPLDIKPAKESKELNLLDEDETPEEVEETPETEEEELKLEDEVQIQTVPRKAEIKAKYPNFFKEFPAVEAAIYRDRQYTEIFPTPADAQEALESANAFSNMHQSLMRGEVKDLFEGIKSEDPEAFKQVVDNLLPHLLATDKEAYFHTVGSIASEVIGKMVAFAKSNDNEQVGIAAQILNQFVFGTNEYQPAQKLAKNLNQDEDVKQQREQLARERYESVVNDISTRTDNVIKKTIDANIDPRGAMTPYIKDIAMTKVQAELEKVLSTDKRFAGIMNGMWRQTIAKNYPKQAVENIRSTYLHKVKEVLPKLIAKARVEAYKGMGKHVRPERDRKGPISPGRSVTQPKSGNINLKEKAKEIPAGVSTLDYLMADD